jgi:hypothetical protein
MIRGILTLLQTSCPKEKHWQYSNAVFVKQSLYRLQEVFRVPGG